MSFRFNSVFAVLLFSGFTFFACVPETPITNPYDPELPADQQQEGLLTGLVKGAQPGSDNAILLEGATLDLKGDFTPVNNPISTPSDGSFNFGELMPGVYSLEIKHPAHFRQVRELSFTAGQHRNLEIILDAIPSTGNTETSSHLTGIIHKAGELNLDVSQQDHSGITVEITGAGIRTTTNQQGRFDLYLASGDYEVDLSAPNYVSQNGIALSTRTGETTELSNSPIVLQSNPGQIKGNAFLETAAENTHDAIDVVLLGSDSAGQTQADGSFLLTGVEAGTYTLQASKTDYDTTTVPGVSVRGGLLSTVADFTLYRSRGGIRGQVGTSIAETDLSGILISLSGTNISTTTNASGLFLIENIPTGSYQFTARLNGFQDASSEVFTVLAN
ncbi:carboxypeptidase regulatory-like domain-containing protein, partial [Myxococcota bacterium]|nr:carboxypeptidase regulatory-like domain-containing protein [Myxococcota bacterium]